MSQDMDATVGRRVAWRIRGATEAAALTRSCSFVHVLMGFQEGKIFFFCTTFSGNS